MRDDDDRPAIRLPNKLYFRIGEVAGIVGVRPHVIRYWETEFPAIRPAKSKTGQRVYSRREVELVAMIRHLLHERRFTIDGARRALREDGVGGAVRKVRRDIRAGGIPVARETAEALREIAAALRALAARLDV
ncbi:MAG: MerR family transcriptional regulator, partial [Myxococcota bacterium]|nr:MerR family transcriptional regulator [Myxococcota bacterium]